MPAPGKYERLVDDALDAITDGTSSRDIQRAIALDVWLALSDPDAAMVAPISALRDTHLGLTDSARRFAGKRLAQDLTGTRPSEVAS